MRSRIYNKDYWKTYTDNDLKELIQRIKGFVLIDILKKYPQKNIDNEWAKCLRCGNVISFSHDTCKYCLQWDGMG